MKHALRCLSFSLVLLGFHANAQSVSSGWDAYRKQGEEQKQSQSATPVPSQPVAHCQSVAPTQPNYCQPDSSPSYPTPAPQGYARAPESVNRKVGGFFVGLQYGVVDVTDGDENLAGINLGYRWQAGRYVGIGIEGGLGRDQYTYSYSNCSYYSCYQYRDEYDATYAYFGGNARFQFGHSPMFAIVRLGVMSEAYVDAYGDINSGSASYVGAGLGVDLGRHVDLNVTYNGVFGEYNDAGVAMGALEFRF